MAISFTLPSFFDALHKKSVEQNEQPLSNTAKTSSIAGEWLGRGVTVVKHGSEKISSLALLVFEDFCWAISQIIMDANTLSNVCRKLNKPLIPLYEQLRDTPGSMKKFQEALKSGSGLIDSAQAIGDTCYFVNKEYKQDNWVNFVARISVSVTNFAGAALWFQDLKFFNLSKIADVVSELRVFAFVPKVVSAIPGLRDNVSIAKMAASIGDFQAFSFVNKVSIGDIAIRTLTLAYALWAVDALRRLVVANNLTDRVQAGLDVVSKSSECAFAALAIVGATNLIGLGVLAGVCVTFACSATLWRAYSESHREEINALTA